MRVEVPRSPIRFTLSVTVPVTSPLITRSSVALASEKLTSSAITPLPEIVPTLNAAPAPSLTSSVPELPFAVPCRLSAVAWKSPPNFATAVEPMVTVSHPRIAVAVAEVLNVSASVPAPPRSSVPAPSVPPLMVTESLPAPRKISPSTVPFTVTAALPAPLKIAPPDPSVRPTVAPELTLMATAAPAAALTWMALLLLAVPPMTRPLTLTVTLAALPCSTRMPAAPPVTDAAVTVTAPPWASFLT